MSTVTNKFLELAVMREVATTMAIKYPNMFEDKGDTGKCWMNKQGSLIQGQILRKLFQQNLNIFGIF